MISSPILLSFCCRGLLLFAATLVLTGTMNAQVTVDLVYGWGLGGSNNGAEPADSLTLGSDGSFYGMTKYGGASDYGTVFKMTAAGVLTTLVEFTRNGASNKGSYPEGSLTLGSDGAFYGMTKSGGTNGGTFGSGTVFKMTAAGVLTTLVNFTGNGGSSKGSQPEGSLTQGNDGAFYGMTPYGGSFGFGTVFKMTAAGVLTTLVEFTNNGASNRGAYPKGSLTQGVDGDFYGMTVNGGASDSGTVFKMTTAGVLTTLVEFTYSGASNRGGAPVGRLTQGSDGAFYGMTANGGARDYGTVFKMTPAGVLTTLVEFTWNGASNKGALPSGSLTLGRDGAFYGMTSCVGVNGYGTVFKMTEAGALTTLLEFTNDADGANSGAYPLGDFTADAEGNLYGMTSAGGPHGFGTVIRLNLVQPGIAVFDGSDAGTAQRTDNTGIHDFGGVNTGSSAVQTFTLQNTGIADLTLGTVTLSGANVDQFSVTQPTSTTLAANATTTFTVTFNPTATGAKSAVVSIASNDADENPFEINVAGTGAAPEIAVYDGNGTGGAQRTDDTGAHDFGGVNTGSSAVQTFTLQNTGIADLTLGTVTLSGANVDQFSVTQPTSTTLAANATTTFTVTFNPTATGAKSVVVSIASNDADENPFEINVAGTGAAPEIAVYDGNGTDGAQRTDNTGTHAFSSVNTGSSSAVQTFTIQNIGAADLTLGTVTLGGADADQFSVTQPASTTLAANATTTFTVVFAPLASGAKTATLSIASNDADENPFEIALTGTGTALPQPVFVVQPASQVLLLGAEATFSPLVSGAAPMSYQWKKGTAIIKGATQPGYTIPVTKASDAGGYSVVADNPAGDPVSSQTAYLALVTPISGTQVIKKGTSLSLKATVAAPTGAGVVVRYAWMLGEVVLGNGTRPSGAVVSGADKAALSITKMGVEDAGTYSCLITLETPGNDPDLVNGEVVVQVVDAAPVMNPVPLPVMAYVGEVIDETVSATNHPSSFSVSGLPAGLKMDPKTGRITGQPTAASKKDKQGNVIAAKVSFKAVNAWGTGVALDFSMTIQPLPALTVGTFNGLVQRSTTLNPVADKTEGLGGTLKVVTASTGAVSGSLKLGTVSHTLKGALTTPEGGGNPACKIVIPRKAPDTALTLDFTLDSTTGMLDGTVKDAVTVPNSASVSGALASKNAALAGLYNNALFSQAPAGNAAYPQGTGFLTLSVTAAGTATWGGRLADNTKITGSSSYGPAGQVPVHLLLYANTGSAQGWVEITSGDVDGSLDWFKALQSSKSTTRSYKSGFLKHDLTVEGGRYTKPAKDNILLGLPDSMQVALTGGGMMNGIIQPFTITTANVAQVPANTNNVKVTITAATGLFSGSFTQPGLSATTPRKAEIFGAFIPGSAGGAGFFNLAENPDATGETPANTPMNSGDVEVVAP